MIPKVSRRTARPDSPSLYYLAVTNGKPNSPGYVPAHLRRGFAADNSSVH